MLPYTSRDFNTTFNSIKDIITKIEPRAEVGLDNANVESIIAKIIAGCVDTLSYNQDANILEAFPSTTRDARAIFDLLSIVGYTPKTVQACHLTMTLWDPNYVKSVQYAPFTRLVVDGYDFYNPDSFECAKGVVTTTNWYQGKLIAPNIRNNITAISANNFVACYYPNLSSSVITNDIYILPSEHTNIDSRTIRVYTEDGNALTYVENPYLTNITSSSFSIIPVINSNGYALRFSKDVSSGSVSENLYYFYIRTDNVNVGTNLTPDFTNFDPNNKTTSFSYSYMVEAYKAAETAADARENIVYEFGWRDTPKAIVTKYDCERAILQNKSYVAAVDVRDGNNFSKADPNMLDVHAFIKLNEESELSLDVGSALAYKNKLMTYINKFKMLPLNIQLHIDNVVTQDGELTTKIYGWYPNITVYLKEQVDAQEAGAILYQINEALFERYKYENCNFNEVPRIVDVIETVQNATDMILYLDIDGIYYTDIKENKLVSKEEVTGSFTTKINIIPDQTHYEIDLNTLENSRNIQYHTIKIVDSNNVVIGYDNGDGVIMSNTGYLDNYGSINYTTGKLAFDFSLLPGGTEFYVYHKLEDPTWCKYINNSSNNIKIALESIKA